MNTGKASRNGGVFIKGLFLWRFQMDNKITSKVVVLEKDSEGTIINEQEFDSEYHYEVYKKVKEIVKLYDHYEPASKYGMIESIVNFFMLNCPEIEG